jgi:hypothetical protein
MRSPQFLHVAQQPKTRGTHDAASTFAALPPVRTVKLPLKRESSIDTRPCRSRVPQALLGWQYVVTSASARQTIPNGDFEPGSLDALDHSGMRSSHTGSNNPAER